MFYKVLVYKKRRVRERSIYRGYIVFCSVYSHKSSAYIMKSYKIKDLQGFLMKHYNIHNAPYWYIDLQNVKYINTDPTDDPYIRIYLPEQVYNFKKYRDEDI